MKLLFFLLVRSSLLDGPSLFSGKKHSFLLAKTKPVAKARQNPMPQGNEFVKRRLITRLVTNKNKYEDFDQFGKLIHSAGENPDLVGYQQAGAINSQQEVIPEIAEKEEPAI